MDIYCGTCGEPWEIDTVHEIAEENKFSFNEALSFFNDKGCESLGCKHNDSINLGRAQAFSALYDIMGDDVDGIASMLEDFDVDAW
jgi:hypothetical protein